MRALISWELNRPLVVMTFFAGLVMGFISVHSDYLSPYSTVHVISATASVELSSFSLSGNAFWHVLKSLPRAGFSVYSFLVILLGTLIFRHDRDTGYALTLYTLPYKKSKIFLAKLVSLLFLIVMMLYFPLFLSVFLSSATVAGHIPFILDEAFFKTLLLITLALVYVATLTAFLSMVLRGMFPTLIGSYLIVHISTSIGGGKLPPFSLFIRATEINPSLLDSSVVLHGIFLPLLLIILGVIASERRDVL
ncbi:ABC-2 family transporter permease [Thermococcus nautili]|uniref:ABC-type transport system involved in multi-copper enzyme maturation, permease component n=1 Tax=Thermococcus nautili TaxID=195522 RepID=W8NXB0_9EURY|nr:ABC transporter permease [Thermococcus nautili]AHL23827.1 hypothetical protein BD01_2239 [Thermococcus nautili]